MSDTPEILVVDDDEFMQELFIAALADKFSEPVLDVLTVLPVLSVRVRLASGFFSVYL